MTELPAQFVADRIFLTPRTTSGERLNFLTDTGGAHFANRTLVARLGLQGEVRDIDEGRFEFVRLPLVDDVPGLDEPIAVVETDDPMYAHGLLGAPWFAGRVWTFDCPGRRFLAGGDIPAEHTIPLRGIAYVTVDASIAGASYRFLFDTGATLQGVDGDRGTCFLVSSLFDAWHDEHGWLVVERADQGVEPVMEIPEITIAGHTVGPVEFTRRQDSNFHEWMAQWTDGPTEGALGGSLFRYFRVTADHPRGLVHFAR